MIRALFIFLLLFASVWLGVQLSRDSGYVLIAINHWTIETTLWVGLIILILSFILLYALLHLIKWIMHSPSSLNKWLAKRRAQKAQARTRQGLIEFSEGYWQQAKKHLIKALPDADTPLLNYLTAARAAQEMGDNKLRDDYLREAQQSMPDAKIAVELTQAQLQLSNQQWEQALATLKHLQDLAPHHPYVLKLLMHLYEEINDWPQLIALLPELKKHQVLPNDTFLQLQQHVYLQQVCELIKQNQSQALTTLFANLPKSLADDPKLIGAYCHFLMQINKHTQAEFLLRRCLRKHFDDELIKLYGQVQSNEDQLAFAESLLKKHAHSAPLFLSLGRLCQTNNLWGKAKTYFEKSIALDPTPTAYVELGLLLEQLNDQASACTAYQKGLLLATKEEKEFSKPNIL